MAVYVSAKIVGYPLPVTLKRAGELIQRARDATGMDIAALATRVGQSPSTIRRLESGDTEPSVEQGNALVAAIQCRVCGMWCFTDTERQASVERRP